MLFIVLEAFFGLCVLASLIGKVGAKKYKQNLMKSFDQTNTHDRANLDLAKNWDKALGWLAFGIAVVGVICAAPMCIYTQDPGQASVLVSFTGVVDGINYETGMHTKAPWTKRVEYDIRNNTLSYVGQSGNADSYTGGDVSGPQITFQDANGVTGNLDLNVRYSVRGNAVSNIYNEYKTQQEFVNATLAPDVRSTTRAVLSSYDTSSVYNDRDSIKEALLKTLQDNWEKLGVDVEEIYLQEVRYPDNVVQSFASAQAARAEVETAKANQEKARIEAETNNIKTSALSQQVLMEKLIDAIKNGNGTYIIDTDKISVGVK
ncbi:MAG: prohibitin family protein [Acetobacter sp.]|nr:prohibitin family protein [Acetobacter sp.]